MNKILILLFPLFFILTNEAIGSEITEEKVRKIYHETSEAEKISDYSVLKKYMTSETEISINSDLISYEEYFQAIEEIKEGIKVIHLEDEIISLVVDKLINTATINVQVIGVFLVDDTQFDSTAITDITYGLVKGQIKIISTHSKIMSSREHLTNET